MIKSNKVCKNLSHVPSYVIDFNVSLGLFSLPYLSGYYEQMVAGTADENCDASNDCRVRSTCKHAGYIIHASLILGFLEFLEFLDFLE